MNELRCDLWEHCGGKPSTVQIELIERACVLHLRLLLWDRETIDKPETMERISAQYLAWSNSYARTIRLLGLRASPSPRMTLGQYLAAKNTAPPETAEPAAPVRQGYQPTGRPRGRPRKDANVNGHATPAADAPHANAWPIRAERPATAPTPLTAAPGAPRIRRPLYVNEGPESVTQEALRLYDTDPKVEAARRRARYIRMIAREPDAS